MLPVLIHGARAIAAAPSGPIGLLLLVTYLVLQREIELELNIR